MKRPALALLLIILFSVGNAAALTVPDVIRSYQENPDATTTVTLEIHGIMAGGIIEELPRGYEFVATTHPPESTRLLSHRLCFAFLGEEAIEYTVRIGDEESGITGTWEDFGDSLSGNVHEATTGAALSPSAPVPDVAAPQSGIGIALPLLAVTGYLAYMRRGRT